nr:MAG TPA: hypothetical protein [Bacteriophage sp.]
MNNFIDMKVIFLLRKQTKTVEYLVKITYSFCSKKLLLLI